MTSIKPAPVTGQTVELSPSYTLPGAIVLLGIPVLLVQPWLGSLVSLFGLFLMLQTVSIRLKFSETALDVYRSGNLIRSFPYAEWRNWRIFWKPVPILFYFREVKSIHFLPILFDPKALETCLQQYCPLNEDKLDKV